MNVLRALVVAILMAFALRALAHEFYGRECCGGQDCSSLASERVQAMPSGYVVDGKHHVPHVKALVSPDDHYHGCFPKSLQGNLGCFWAPRPGM